MQKSRDKISAGMIRRGERKLIQILNQIRELADANVRFSKRLLALERRVDELVIDEGARRGYSGRQPR